MQRGKERSANIGNRPRTSEHSRCAWGAQVAAAAPTWSLFLGSVRKLRMISTDSSILYTGRGRPDSVCSGVPAARAAAFACACNAASKVAQDQTGGHLCPAWSCQAACCKSWHQAAFGRETDSMWQPPGTHACCQRHWQRLAPCGCADLDCLYSCCQGQPGPPWVTGDDLGEHLRQHRHHPWPWFTGCHLSACCIACLLAEKDAKGQQTVQGG
jgi:hypothetical protein